MMVVLYHFLGKNKLCDKNSEIILINILKEINDILFLPFDIIIILNWWNKPNHIISVVNNDELC